jgi:hypothetical protein
MHLMYSLSSSLFPSSLYGSMLSHRPVPYIVLLFHHNISLLDDSWLPLFLFQSLPV